ncbi:MAG: HAMP domain-containing histidine kinase, partial [Myxococcales bacterium]|nr:HAMP domain-containing histidine kinase [Myxococcales bacterium]
MAQRPSIELLYRMGAVRERREAAGALAAEAGAEDLVIFVADAEIGTLLPAPGLPQTLPEGLAWARFVRAAPGEATLRYPDLTAPARPVRAVRAGDGSVLALVGGEPNAERVAGLVEMVPVLAAIYRAERAAQAVGAHAAVARHAAAQAEELARSLAAAQADLREQARRKDEFLAMLAHELRNPLATMISGLHVLGTRTHDADLVRPLTVALRQGKQLARIIDDLLDVARITQGKIELRRTVVDLGRLITRAADAAALAAADRRHQLALQVPSQAVFADADPVRIEQAVGNLLNNAIKYTDPGGHIGVSLSVEGGESVVRVRDDGVGIAPELLPRIFGLFVQAEESLARAQGGLGIGLKLVRDLVAMHGGRVEAYSEGLGRVWEFVILLPVVEKPAQAAAQPPGRPPVTVSRRILVVDDNHDAADLL